MGTLSGRIDKLAARKSVGGFIAGVFTQGQMQAKIAARLREYSTQPTVTAELGRLTKELLGKFDAKGEWHCSADLGGMAAAASREACTTTLPFAAIVDRHSGSRGLGSGAYLAGVLRNLSMYSSGQGGGRPRLGERAADGSHEGTWNLGAAPAPRFGAASSTSFSSSAARAVIEGDDIGSF